MSFWKRAAGIVRAELVGADPEGTLRALGEAGIELDEITPKGALTLEFLLRREDLPTAEALCRKRGDSFRVLGRQGLWYAVWALWERKLLLTGLVFLLGLTILLPTWVLFFRVEGNKAVPKAQILWEAERQGLSFGASRRGVRSEKIKNALLEAIPELEWVGVNTQGCTAVISVRERTAPAPVPEAKHQVGNIVAAMDGYILSVTVTQGTGQVQPGQAVKKGEILISGYTDCGICIQAAQAEGEILAQTRRQLDAVTPAQYLRQGKIIGTKRALSLLLGKKRIFFWKDSGILEGSCDRIQKDYPLTLPGRFRLPVSLRVETYEIRESIPETLSAQEVDEQMKAFSARYLPQQMIGGQILEAQQRVLREKDVYRLRGSYLCQEMLGREKREGNGESNGQASGQSGERGTG